MYYIVTYDLNDPRQAYEQIYKIVGNLRGQCLKLNESVFLMKMPGPYAIQKIKELLSPAIDSSDSLFIAAISPQQVTYQNPTCDDYALDTFLGRTVPRATPRPKPPFGPPSNLR